MWQRLFNSIPVLASAMTLLGVARALWLGWPIGVVWEVAALVLTLVLCFHAWADILWCGKHKIARALTFPTGALLAIFSVLVLFTLVGSMVIALAPDGWHDGFRQWGNVQLVEVHGAVICLGALFAGCFDLTIAFANANQAVIDKVAGPAWKATRWYRGTEELCELVKTRPDVAPELNERLQDLAKERKLARELFRIADVPAMCAYVCVSYTVFVAGNTPKTELKMFIAGSVAFGLVIVNFVHVSCRFMRSVYG